MCQTGSYGAKCPNLGRTRPNRAKCSQNGTNILNAFYSLFPNQYSTSPIPQYPSPIPYSISLIPHPLSFIPYSLYLIPYKGLPKKNLTKIGSSFCLIYLATNMLECYGIIHWKGGIHSFVWSTKTFLQDIQEPRYKQIKMGYQISKCLNIGQSQCLEI